MKTFEYLMRFYHPNLGIFGTVRVQAIAYAEAVIEAQKQIGMTDMVTGGEWSPEEVERQRMINAIEEHNEEFGCLYGAACCMMGPHFPSECYTAEMIEEDAEQGK